MQKLVFSLVWAMALLMAALSCAAGIVQNSSENMTANIVPNMTMNTNTTGIVTLNDVQNVARPGKVLRAGLDSFKATGVLGGKNSSSTGEIEIGLEPKSAFNLSQRQGSVSKFKFNSDIYTQLFSRNLYTRTKPIYQAPDGLSSRKVYNITGYPVIMLPNSIP